MSIGKRVRKGSHCEKILNYLKVPGNSLTSMECVDELRIMYLPQRISELESYGYMIDRKTITEGNAKFTRYSYAKENEQ